ncbi:hypothetical protein Q9S36_32370 [Microbacterium sp. ARD31]|jgi:hypothetical protein|uniref:hypothetical protein n=1 Tax=Microbacterium sp. ARD31 TaxID=2962576 RepID=UPI0028822A72|nr:hypothetical protein [Microbacterium sp. ARD31]MDT0184890.1 hypothetical protein [Microbacterium sp. ARD31]
MTDNRTPSSDRPDYNEPVRNEPVRNEPVRDGRVHDEHSRDGRVHDDNVRDRDLRDGRAHDEPVTRAYDTDRDAATAAAVQHDVLQREREKFGGMKFGSAFFGWLTAMGAAILLTALVAAIGGALGLGNPEAVDDAAAAAEANPTAATIIGAIAIALVLFIAYFAGGYVAGRMARFSGAKQGVAVWLWAVVIAIVIAIITALGGSQWDILANLGGFPRIPVSAETATTTGILTAIGAAIVTLAAAVLGGMAGMRYHRRVDRVGFGV